ncbi:MAG TPA: plasmid stabilization protein [Lentisphaeria bacterium]|nr:plasmid stabilization protein [Lentisphaeria bacterium]
MLNEQGLSRNLLSLSAQKSLEDSIKSLESFPHKGHIPSELERISVLNYLEVHFKPYRIIYSVEGTFVHVFFVIDGRRNVQSIMNRRFLRV